jgi:undecaprenyl-diphosphatase
MSASLLVRLDAHDRALMLRCAQRPVSGASRLGWCAVTHLGGAPVAIAASALPALGCCAWDRLSRLALAALVVSHVMVQLVKRLIGRGRPSLVGSPAAIPYPDRFSFPSGHATASFAVALAYATAFPRWSGPLLLLALLVGFSRIRLGVHYPSDVLVGQLLAALTTLLLAHVV